MQEASGAEFTDLTDLNWSAQPSSDDLATDHGPHSFPRISFTPLNQAIAHYADASVRRLPAPLSQGSCAVSLSARQAMRCIVIAEI